MANLTHQYADQTRSPFLSGHGAKNILVAELDIAKEDLVASARWDFFKVPADAVVTAVYLHATELDKASTLTLAIKKEDVKGQSAGTLLAADTVGQSGGWKAANSLLPLLTENEDFYIFVEVGAAPTTNNEQAGKVKLVVEYFRTRT